MAVSPSPDQTITGRVVSVNPKGLRLDGHDDWFNFSKFATELVPPMRGQSVVLTLDNQGSVRGVQATNGHQEAVSGRQPSTASPDLRELRIIRQSCLKSAIERAAGRPDVTRIAEAFEAWVLRPYSGPELTDAF
jgi:hypothetical protein